ncbi:hypothetical protein F5Y17DRAFT_467235 [Xylariaceae sp. FL0594]|nr:hypothetical protein F5Y17DRAFT_467235 [Xylariaceae sp. FL0594]
MKLRQSNRKKRFEPPDYALDLGADDALARVNSSDDDFVVDAEGGLDDGEQLTDEVLSEDDADGVLEGDGSVTKKRPSGSGTAKAKRGKTATVDLGVITEVPPYPSDPGQRWTRTYIGPIKRWTRFFELIDWWFGDKADRRIVLDGFLRLWWAYPLIPPRILSSKQLEIAQAGWMGKDFSRDQRSKFRQLYDHRLVHQFRQQESTGIDRQRATHSFIPEAPGNLTVYLGHFSEQKQYHIRHGESISLSASGNPITGADVEASTVAGWLFDVAGIPISMSWVPAHGQVDQLLAIAVVPFSDQAYYQNLKDAPRESAQKSGSVQIFRFKSAKDAKGILRPLGRAPSLAQAVCFSWGRVSRMQWCPVPLEVDDPTRLLAVLCVDGRIRIIGIPNATGQDGDEVIEIIHRPMVLLEPPKECSIEITCFTWINMNRVAAGLSDGSVVVWSVSPPRMLQRHPVHSTAIIDIASGFPSDPFLVSTIPIGGVLTVTDLSRPSAESSYHPNMMVSLQPNLLSWSPLLRGYASMWPSAFAGNPNLTFLPARGFPLCRHLTTVTGQPTCVNMGTCHTYIMIGTTDGSVYVFNVLRKLSSHREKTVRVKLLQHEYRPPLAAGRHSESQGANSRGMSRILHGFLPESNSHPTGMKMAETQRQNRQNKGKGKSTSKTAKPRAKQSDQPAVEADEEAAMTSGPGPIMLHEPLTRITAVAWNPNVEFSWWAAIAMGSGLVRVIDMGAEPTATATGGNDTQDGDQGDIGSEGGYNMHAMEQDDEVGGGDDDIEMASGDE